MDDTQAERAALERMNETLKRMHAAPPKRHAKLDSEDEGIQQETRLKSAGEKRLKATGEMDHG